MIIYIIYNIYFIFFAYIYYFALNINYFIFYLSHCYFRAEPPAKCVKSAKENSTAWTCTTVSQIQIFFIFCPGLSSLLPPAACFQSCATPHLPAHLFIELHDKLNWRVGLDWKQLQQKKSPSFPLQTVAGQKVICAKGEDEIIPDKMVFSLKLIFMIL